MSHCGAAIEGDCIDCKVIGYLKHSAAAMTISSSFFHTHSERDRRLRRLVYRYCFFSRCGVKLFMVFSYCCRFDLRVRLWRNSTKLLYKTVERTIVDNYFFLYISNLLLQTSARRIQYFSFVPLSSYFRRPVIFFFFTFQLKGLSIQYSFFLRWNFVEQRRVDRRRVHYWLERVRRASAIQ